MRVAIEVSGVSELNLLTDFGGELTKLVTNSGAISQSCGISSILRVSPGLISSLGDLVSGGDELLILGDEVGLRADMHQGRASGSNQAVAGLTVGTLRSLSSAGNTQDVNGLIEVAIGLSEGLLGVHHAGASSVAQFLDLSSSDSHRYLSPV